MKFGRLLTEGVHLIRLREQKTMQIVQDELGFLLNRDGGSAIRYWRMGHVPAQAEDVAVLARAIVQRGGADRHWLLGFLESGEYTAVAQLTAELFPSQSSQTAVADPVPFVVGPPIMQPRQFYGREAELSRIFAVLRGFPLQNAAIIGPYRSGKTSLLHYLKTITTTEPFLLRPQQNRHWLPQPEQYRWVMVDFQDVRMGRQERLLRYILQQLALPVPQPCDLLAFMDVVSEELEQPAVILMDEIGAGLAAPELDQQFWWSLRSLGSNLTQGKLAFVLTAHRSPAELAQDQGKPSPFFNIFGHVLHLGPLTETEAQELIASSPIPFAAEDVDWMLQASGRWPCLLQILGHTRLMALQEGRDEWREEGMARLRPFAHLLT